MVKNSFFREKMTLIFRYPIHNLNGMKKNFIHHASFVLVTMTAFSLAGCQLEKSSSQSALAPKSPAKVQAIVVKKSSFVAERHYAGSIAEGTATAVSFNSPGTIKTLNVSEGKKISKGALIGTLDDTAARNALEIAQAMKSQAEDARARMEKLYKNKSISEIQWMEVESKYRQAVAAEQIAKKTLDDCKLFAPTTGIVSNKKIEVGQNVLPGVPVFNIVDISKVKAKAFVPESEISSIKLKDKVDIRIEALGGKSFEGKITNKGISANILSRSYEIEVELKNGNSEFLPGMIVDMAIQSKDSVSGFALPSSVILLDERNQPFVWKISNGTAERKDVEIFVDPAVSGSYILVQNLDEGDSIIVQGSSKVGRGDKVIATIR